MKKITVLAASLMLCGAAWAAPAPQFPGGETALKEYIASNIVYPQRAKENGIEGVVRVEFTVNADGSVGAIKILRLVDPDLEAEAINLVKNMPKWIPADGGAARTVVEIPFLLGDGQ